MNDFQRQVSTVAADAPKAVDIRTIQVNLGFQCNQACAHCHVEASPAGRIRTGKHCFGCTAACGSSCTGALV